MRAVVLGATGLMGSGIVRQLRACGWEVDTPLHRDVDMRSEEVLAQYAACDAIFHAADTFAGNASLTAARGFDQISDNALMDLNILRAWRERQRQAKLVAFLSLWAYPERGTTFRADEDIESGAMPPQTAHYGAAKRLLMHALRTLEGEGMRSAVLTLPNVYGPGDRSQRIVPTILRGMLAGGALTLRGDGHEMRDFVHVDDAAFAAVDCATSDITGRIHVSAAQPTSIRHLAAMAAEATGYQGAVRFEGESGASRCLAASPVASRWTFRDLSVGLTETVRAMRDSQ